MFIPVNLNDAPEAKPVAAGRYNLTILEAEETKTKEKQKPQFRISIGIDGHDDSPPINHYVGIPGDGDEPKAAQFKSLLLRRFMVMFAIPIDPKGFDTTQLAMGMRGAKASNAEVQLDDSGDYNRLVVPKIRGETSTGQRVAPPPPSKR